MPPPAAGFFISFFASILFFRRLLSLSLHTPLRAMPAAITPEMALSPVSRFASRRRQSFQRYFHDLRSFDAAP